jgi:hypothetical protein
MNNQTRTLGIGKMDKEQEIIDAVKRELEMAIPRDFGIQVEMLKSPLSKQIGEDFKLQFKFVTGEVSDFAGQVKTSLSSTGVYKAIAEAQRQLAAGVKPLVSARYISVPARAALREASISFADATGNVFIADKANRLLLTQAGAQNDPWRKAGRPSFSLKGATTQLVVKALIELQEPYETSTLIELSGAGRGSTYRVLDLLEDAGFICREGKKVIQKVDWEKLAKAWAQDTGIFQSNATYSYVAPRGLDHVLDLLRKRYPADYSVSGTAGAAPFSSSASLYTLLLYTTNPPELAKALGLRETESGANVIMGYPNTDGPFMRTVDLDGLRVVSAPLAYRDLASGPGRNPEEAKNLLDWMVRNVEVWRARP